MTRALWVEVGEAPPERAAVDLLLLPIFSGERPLRGSASRIDWRLCGRLSALLVDGRLEGRCGEAVLLGAAAGLAAPRVLALGAGPRATLDAARSEALVRDGVSRALALGVGSAALALGELALRGERGEPEVRPILSGAAAAASAVSEADLRLVLLTGAGEERRAADLLRRARPARLPTGFALRLPGSASRAGAPSAADVPGVRS